MADGGGKGGIGIGAAVIGFIYGNGAAFVDHVAVGRDDVGADDYTASLTITVGDDHHRPPGIFKYPFGDIRPCRDRTDGDIAADSGGALAVFNGFQSSRSFFVS